MKPFRNSLAMLVFAAASTASAQLETAFTYQGRLADTNGPLSGSFDFVFSLYDDAGEQVGHCLTNTAVPVTEGHFVQTLDFGPDSFRRRFVLGGRLFVGPGEWLEISVRANHDKTFQTLAPRQRLTPAPYASTVTGRLPSGALEGNYTEKVNFGNASNVFLGRYFGDASGLTNLPATSLTGQIQAEQLGSAVARRAGGNAFSGNQTISGGDVGVGTVAPEGQLDVRGTIVSQGGGGHNQNILIKKNFALGTANAQMIFSHRSSGRELWLFGNEPINGNRNLQSWDYGNNAVRFPADGQTLYINEGTGRVGVGRQPTDEALEVQGNTRIFGDMSCATLTILGGADLAEPFAMSDEAIQPGAVVVIDSEQPGRLKLSTSAYDHRVAGIVSGAGGVQPGISMLQTQTLESGRNVALSGRAFALVDATRAPVRPGDLLTTSDTPGHAMKVANPALAQGAILGKAMSTLPSGRGLVLVLVSLQ